MSTTPQPRPATTESQPITTPAENEGIDESERGSPATFDTGCRRRLGCLFDDENSSISPAHTTRRDF